MRKGVFFGVFLVSLCFPIGEMLFAEQVDAIALVNDVPISTKIFEKRMKRLTGEGQGNFDSFEGKKELLDVLIAREVLNQKGRELGFDKSKRVQERVNEVIEELVINEVVDYIIREKVTEAKMSQYYGKNQDAFREVRANHILLKTEDEAQKTKKKLDDGADFSTLAKEVSIDPATAARGGDLGFFTRERMVKAFADAAFSMKINEIVGPVKSAFGYHIIQVVEKRDSVAFESLAPAQLQNLRGVMINWEIDRLKEKAKITVDEERLRQAASSSNERPPKGGDSDNH